MSATNILRHAWRHLLRKPGNLVLSFWYLFILFFFQLFAMRGLGSGFQNWLKALNPSKMTMTNLPPLPHGVALKLALTYLTMILIVFPFVIGALYGGVADSLKTANNQVGLFAFFRYGSRLFWESMGLFVGIVVGTTIMLGVGIAINLLFTLLGGHSQVLGVITSVVAAIITLTIMFLWFAVVLFWLGAVYFGGERIWPAFTEALQWVWHHKAESLRLLLLTAVIVLVATIFFSLFSLVPIIGQFFAIMLYAGVLTLIAIEANVFYREATRHDMPPIYRI
ncbi:hypothetical protein [Sulfobacillus thermosulfidooxidans]|uniref:hypothetical protein n=1 Tax=Sulfobacillus thermosulfidooxidans TaxID=28034 RepID=UPI0006B55792|nr:hypothetical protein [Sulfobacillus thermosulfidooxidans]